MDGSQLHSALVDGFGVFVGFIADAKVRIGKGYRVVSVPSFPIPLVNAVWADGTDEASALADLPDALDDVRAAGVAPAVVGREHVDARVLDAARDLGLTHEERIPGMAVSRDRFTQVESRSAIDCRLVGSDAELLDVALDVTARGFGAPREFFASLFASGMQAEGLEVWVAFADGVPVSTATGLTRGAAVGVFDVATPEEHRRKGYAAIITARAVESGFAAGAGSAFLQSSEMGFGLYEALGVRTVTTHVVRTRPHD
jgi:hypothetical protein